jgi:hypothetical protein
MPRFLFSVHHDYSKPLFDNDEEFHAMMAATGVFNSKLRAAGELVFAGGLAEPVSASTVDGRGERPLMTDGPFLEGKEAIGGFWIVELPSREVALERAAEGSAACRAVVEVRQFHDA